MAPRHSALATVDDGLTVIGASVVVRGRLEGDEGIRIDGRIEGSIAVTENVVVTAHARVVANISARAVVVEGVVVGDIEASASIVIRPSARVVGNLLAPKIAIADGASVRGRVDMGDYVPPDDRALRAAHGSGALAAGASGALRPRSSQAPARQVAPAKASLRPNPAAARPQGQPAVRSAAPSVTRNQDSAIRPAPAAPRRAGPPEIEASIERYDTHPSGEVTVNEPEDDELDDDGYELGSDAEDGEDIEDAEDGDFESEGELEEVDAEGSKVPHARMPARGKRRIQTRG